MSWNDKNVLITGISGFVGSYLAEELLRKGTNVFGLIRRKADGTKPKNLVDMGIQDRVKLIEGDITNIYSLAQALDISQPEVIFHLASQSYVPRSFIDPMEVMETNILGTGNILEAVRMKDLDTKIVFAGSSEEYGLVISSEEQYQEVKDRYGVLFPEPERIPEVPVNETNPLRPMSPYAVSKVAGDYLMRNYFTSYGLKTIVSRAFNHEGAGRGVMFVTSTITKQIMQLKFNEIDKIRIGNVNVFRDWSHVKDIVNGYLLLAENGKYGDVYNQGSMRGNSVITYILMSLEEAGWEVNKIETFGGDKIVENPAEIEKSEMFGIRFEKTKIDRMLLENEISFELEDNGIWVYTDKSRIGIEFDKERFRPVEVPLLISDTSKIQKLGFKIKYSLRDIIRDQLNYFMKRENRHL